MQEKTAYIVGVSLVACFAITMFALPVSSSELGSSEDTEIEQMDDDGNVSLNVQPVEDGKTQVGTTEEYEVVVSGAENGIAAYTNKISLVGGEANITNWYENARSNQGRSILSRSAIRNGNLETSGEGPYLDLISALNTKTFDADEEIVIATFDVRLDSEDNVSIVWRGSENEVAYQDGRQVIQYNTQNKQGTSLSNSDVPDLDVNDNGEFATDTSGDGLLNDVDGDGDFDVFDVQSFYNNFQNPVVQDNSQYFDFNSDSEVSIFDVQELFERV